MAPYKQFAGFGVRECVVIFDHTNMLALPADLHERLVTLCERVWNSREPKSATLLHEFLFQDRADAGLFRQESLMNQMGVQRNYPRSDMVPRLMEQVFRPSYERALAGDVTAIGASVEESLWRVGAMLRIIHPFRTGNRLVSWVIENQLRNWSDLPPIMQLRPKPSFDLYRNFHFWPYANQMLR